MGGGPRQVCTQVCERSSSQLVRALKMTSSRFTLPSGSPAPSCRNRLLAASLLERQDMAAFRTGSVISTQPTSVTYSKYFFLTIFSLFIIY